MRSRALNKRIDIYQITNIVDDFGGSAITETLLNTSWADVKHININSPLSTELGVLDASDTVVIKLRKRNDLVIDLQTMYVLYRGDKYFIKSYPTNVNFEDSMIQFIAKRESLSQDNG